MRRDTIEGSLSLKKSTVISCDTCGDCCCLFKNVEYTPGCLFSCLTKERHLCHRSGGFDEQLSLDTRGFQLLKPRHWHDKQLRLVSLCFLSILRSSSSFENI